MRGRQTNARDLHEKREKEINHGPANFVCRITVYREGMEGGWEEPLLTGILVVFYGFFYQK